VIPPQLAYGGDGMLPRIGPNEALVFEIELLDIKSATDKALIHAGGNMTGHVERPESRRSASVESLYRHLPTGRAWLLRGLSAHR
jgi:FKBP-type peptidyl-prolyl cis-trans isomerases 1